MLKRILKEESHLYFKKRLTSVQIIILFYLGAVTISTLLLSLPIAHNPGVDLSFIDALFTAASAVSVTGLTVVNTAETFSGVGAFIIAVVLQIGGVGVMTLGTFIYMILGKKIGLKQRQLIRIDHNQSTLSGLVKLMRQIVGLILLIELVGAIILSLYYLKYFPTVKEAIIQGTFASISATTNGGFDITGSSLVPFANDYFVQFITIILIILGAIGFPVLIEVKEFLFRSKEDRIFFRFSLFAKLTTVTYFLLIIVGVVAIGLFEWNHFFAGKEWHQGLFYALFQSISTRSAGLSTMDVSEFSEATQLVLSSLMFIGASPSSVGGGIRTTTFALTILFFWNFSRGKHSIKIFRREVHESDMRKALVVPLVGVMMCTIAVIILVAIEDFLLMEIIFEVCSAFGTTGLSMGITPDLSTIGKLILIFLMFVGRIGILSFLFMIKGKDTKPEAYRYPKEHIIIG
ncbi:TrkH family potassium uptake protein [Bacillus solimangrovi]|uniref:Ktr system potassium uptake protein D n=1 Tax=Bacillus solimangrovi TaxID=1305675 RepID=A0A1E5LAC2_9BACI|nr:TrkH family potassium uptake protein [Bacillus solimangrovi]OEH91048.1 Ktr system potassium uptake protein D [Bacillus solimangrovi]